jgi:hypothetical protein
MVLQDPWNKNKTNGQRSKLAQSLNERERTAAISKSICVQKQKEKLRLLGSPM